MDEKEELEWLRQEKERDMRFDSGMIRGIGLSLLSLLPFHFLPATFETNVIMLIWVFTSFAIGFASAHFGRFKVTYKRKKRR